MAADRHSTELPDILAAPSCLVALDLEGFIPCGQLERWWLGEDDPALTTNLLARNQD